MDFEGLLHIVSMFESSLAQWGFLIEYCGGVDLERGRRLQGY
jgi:hypothetical protein